jgi:predicted DsbA family dithiol-disulfide isomerase
MEPPLKIDVVSDIVCPWCFIGKRKLDVALADLGKSEPALGVEVRWHPFQLNPDLPAEGMSRGLRRAEVRRRRPCGTGLRSRDERR